MITIHLGEETSYNKRYWKHLEDFSETYLYNNQEMSAEHLKNAFICPSAKNIKAEKVFELAAKAWENGIKLNYLTAQALMNAEHKNGVDAWMQKYIESGVGKVKYATDEAIDHLRDLFIASPKFRGRVPGILIEISNVAATYGIPYEDCVNKFNIQNISRLISLDIPKSDVALLYTHLDSSDLAKIKNNEIGYMVADLLSKGLLKEKENYINLAYFILNHNQTNIDDLWNIYDEAKHLEVTQTTTIADIQSQLFNLSALDVVKKIENEYKKANFNFSECKCELKKTSVKKGRYTAFILDGQDPRQVILGDAKHGGISCCQHLGDAGETSMMYGLTNDKAGFWAIVDTITGEIKAEAEVWEVNEDTLVFDNIEFSNNDDGISRIELYKEIIGEWLFNTPYKNIAMGCGYNELYDVSNSFRIAPNFVPNVTAKDVFIMSYEKDAELPEFWERTAPNKMNEDNESNLMRLPSIEVAQELLDAGRINYYDYLYSDVDDDKGIVWLKENDRISDYFEINQSRYKNRQLEEKKKENPLLFAYIDYINDVNIEEEENYEMGER